MVRLRKANVRDSPIARARVVDDLLETRTRTKDESNTQLTAVMVNLHHLVELVCLIVIEGRDRLASVL